MRIFMLSGYAGSGKDTVGKLFVDLGFTRYAFADALKEYSANLHDFPFSMTLTNEGKNTLVYSKVLERTATVRELLIYDAAKVKGTYGDLYWARIVADKIKDEGCNYVVITDWRYLNELEHLNNTFPTADIVTFRIVRPGIQILDDPSEHELDKCSVDLVITNAFSLSMLTEQITSAYEAFTYRRG